MTYRTTLSHHIACVNGLALSPEGDFLLSGGEASTLSPWFSLRSDQGMTPTSLYGTSTHQKNVKLYLPHSMALSHA